MEGNAVLNQDEILRLRKYHEAHFPGQNVPTLNPSDISDRGTTSNSQVDDEDNLGFYDDGVKRTLTDDQIAMFRNSEIQRIIQNRQRASEREESRKQEKEERVSNNERQEEHKTWTRHFDEAPESVDTLMYDDEPQEERQIGSGSKKFQWPKLG